MVFSFDNDIKKIFKAPLTKFIRVQSYGLHVYDYSNDAKKVDQLYYTGTGDSQYYSHEMGHTFATTALLNGVDVKTVSSMLGHYSAGFTLDTYTHVTTQMQQAAADKMGGFLENALPDEGTPELEPPKRRIIPFERVG